MKKLLAITLTLCMIFSVIMVAPVSAAGGYIEKDITSNATAYFMTYINSAPGAGSVYEGYTPDKAIDGSTDTICYGAQINTSKDNHLSGNIVYLNLGQAYDLTDVTITYATSEQYVAARTALGATFEKTMNTSAVQFVSNEEPVFTSSAITSSYEALDNSALASGSDTYQYVGVYVPYSYGVAVAEISVKATVWANHLQTVERQITPTGADMTGGQISNAANVASSVIDNSEDTMAIIDGYGYAMYVDLGAEYTLTKIEVVYPSTSAITSYISENSISTDSVDNMNKQTQVRVDTTTTNLSSNNCTNYGTRLNASVVVGTDTTATYTTSDAVRYIAITQGTSSNPTAVAEIRVYGYVTEEFVPEVTITHTKTQYGVEAKENIAEGATVTMYQTSSGTVFEAAADYAGAKMVDGDEDTFAYIKKQWGGSPASTNYAIVDLSEAKNIDGIEITVPTLEDITAATTYTNTTTYPPSNVNLTVSVALTNEIPTAADYTTGNGVSVIDSSKGYQINDGGSLKNGLTWSNNTGNTLSYRYIVIFAPYSYGAAVSELKVYDDTEQVEKLRTFFEAEHNIDTLDSFGAYIIPFSLFNDDLETNTDVENVENTSTADLVSGTVYAVDVTGIPAEAYDVNILAMPYVSYDGVYYFGTSVTTTVNDVIAVQAQ